MKLSVRGIIPPVVTPLLDNDKLDAAGLEKVIDHVIEGGVHGLFVLGTTGEGPSLSWKLRKEVVRRTAVHVAGRVPVYAGITDTSFDNSLELATFAAECGIDGVVIAPPYYMPISQDEMRDYLEALVPRLPLPFIIYNIPSCTGLHMTFGTIRKAFELGAVAVKDSSGDADYMSSLVKEFRKYEDFAVITGTEMFLPETIINGGQGAIAGGANIFPGLFVELYNASVARDMPVVGRLLFIVKSLNENIYNSSGSPRIIQGIKSALAALGLCSSNVAWPLRQSGAVESHRIKNAVVSISEMIEQASHKHI